MVSTVVVTVTAKGETDIDTDCMTERVMVSTAVGTLTAKGETVIGTEPPRISGYLKHAE